MNKSFKKVFPLIGIVAGVLVIVFGVMFAAGVFDVGVRNAVFPESYHYENGYATFGADFYTYVTNNSYAAASAVQTVSENQVALAGLMGICVGVILIAFGIFMVAFFGIGFSKAKEEENAKLASEKKTSTEKAEDRALVIGEDLPDIE